MSLLETSYLVGYVLSVNNVTIHGLVLDVVRLIVNNYIFNIHSIEVVILNSPSPSTYVCDVPA